MTKEQYESIAVAELRELAKAREMKGVSAMRKAELVEAMIQQDNIDREKEKTDSKKTEEKKSL